MLGWLQSASTCGVMEPGVGVHLRHALLMHDSICCRWCQFEFFYSAIDRPWFMQSAPQVSTQAQCHCQIAILSWMRISVCKAWCQGKCTHSS